MGVALSIAVVLLIAVLALASYVQRVYTEMGKFLSREFQENIEAFESRVLPRLGVSRDRAALSMAVVEQLSTAAIAMILAYDVFRTPNWTRTDLLQAIGVLLVIVIVFNRILPFVLFARTRGHWLEKFFIPLRALIYLMFPITLVIGFTTSVASLTREQADPQPETQSEAVDALIEAGQEEGILEESDRELIQSVVEFGDKTVREVMTPRPEIFAVPVETTVEQFKELLRDHPYSRVPVYEGTVDQIVGIVFAHDLLQVPDTEAQTRTVGELMRTDVQFVPETKRVSDLLREMQKTNAHMVIVLDEYGAVAGLVTIEDLVEEIVGEIRDEHENGEAEVVKEDEHTYVVPGNSDIDLLDELFGVRLDEWEATTVGGLVSEIAGRIPQRGETVVDDGLRFEVLDATDRLVEKVRVHQVQPQEEKREIRA